VDIILAGLDHDVGAAFTEVVQKSIDAFVVADDQRLAAQRAQVLMLAARHKLHLLFLVIGSLLAG
jgi:hypothetical protein